MPTLSSWKSIRTLFVITGAVTAGAFLYDYTVGMNVFRSFFNGESSIGFWMRQVGVPFGIAFLIAVACSTYDTFCWFCCGNAIRRHQAAIREGYARIADLKNADSPLIVQAYHVGEVIFRFFVPQKKQFSLLQKEECFAEDWHLYLPLILYGFWPGGIWTGIGYAFEFDLNQAVAFVVLSAANALKALAFGLLAIVVNPWVVLVMVLSLPFLTQRIERYLKGLLVRFTILRSNV